MEIAIVSGKGGTGKSCISAAFASLAQKVVLADCDVDAANQYLLFNPAIDEDTVFVSGYKAVIDDNLCTRCGLCADHCAFGAISTDGARIEISETGCDGCFLCSRICPEAAITMVANDRSRLRSGSFRYGYMVYGRLAPGEENSGKLVQQVREKAAGLAEANRIESIILDGPPGIGCPVNSTITGTDKVIMVTEPSVSGFSDLKRISGLVEKFRLKRYVIINKSDLNQEFCDQISDWCSIQNIPVIAQLPFDDAVVKAMVHQKTVIEWDPRLEISRLLVQAWNNVHLI